MELLFKSKCKERSMDCIGRFKITEKCKNIRKKMVNDMQGNTKWQNLKCCEK
jgi:hypothetical protein